MREMMLLIKENKIAPTQTKQQMRRGRKREKTIKKGTMTHQFAKTAERNTLQKPEMNAGS
jgi:hypothetical protein